MQHDVDYTVCGNDKSCKDTADKKMVKSLDAIPWRERQWGHAAIRNTIAGKKKSGLGARNSEKKPPKILHGKKN